MKRSLFFLLLLAILITSISSYLHNDERRNSTNGTAVRQISLFHYFSGDLSGGIDEMVATVNNKDPNKSISASALDHEAFKTMIHTSLERGNPPELFSYWAGERVQQLVDRGQITPIDDMWERHNLSDMFSREIIESAVTYNGKKYLLPITQHIVVFFYNKQLFTSLDLPVPYTWDELLTVCRALVENDITPFALGARERWPAQFWFDYLLLRSAGPEYRHRLMQGKQKYTDDQVMTVYSKWADLLKLNYFNGNANQLDWSEATTLVKRGEAAMTLMGTWAIQLLNSAPHKLTPGEDYDFFPFPAVHEDFQTISVGPIDGIILSENSANHTFAKEVLAYFAQIEPQQTMSRGSGALSPNRQVPVDFYTPFKQRLRQVITDSSSWAFNYDLATPHVIADKGMDSFAELIEFPRQYETIVRNLQKEIELEEKP